MSPVFQQVVLGALVAFGLSLLATRVVRDAARRYGLFDRCDDRKVHKIPVPYMGGVAIAVAAAVAIFVEVILLANGQMLTATLAAVLGGGLSMHLLGLIDDVTPIRARHKLMAQVGIAAATTAAGLSVQVIAMPGFGTVSLGPVVGFVFAVIWLVGVTNAFNLIDGVDGLAAGVAVFALGTFAVSALLAGQPDLAAITAILMGATFGFLRFNTFPATIFLGDSGSLLLGFLLAGLGLLVARDGAGAYSIALPIVALAVPIMDTALTILRRFLRRQPIFVADRGHVHHRLLARGYPPSRVAQLLYGACAFASVSALLLALQADRFLIVTLFTMLGLAVFVHELRFHEFQELARLIRRGASPRRVIGRNVRLREAGASLAELESGHDIVRILDRTFRDDPVPKVELRLCRGFLDHQLHVVRDDGRGDDELAVWSRSRGEALGVDWWEVSVPLFGPDNQRIGTLVLWEGGALDIDSVSYLQVIARYLRVELERKLCALGWPSSDDVSVSRMSSAVESGRAPASASFVAAPVNSERRVADAQGA